jgi:hypothetical protein
MQLLVRSEDRSAGRWLARSRDTGGRYRRVTPPLVERGAVNYRTRITKGRKPYKSTPNVGALRAQSGIEKKNPALQANVSEIRPPLLAVINGNGRCGMKRQLL